MTATLTPTAMLTAQAVAMVAEVALATNATEQELKEVEEALYAAYENLSWPEKQTLEGERIFYIGLALHVLVGPALETHMVDIHTMKGYQGPALASDEDDMEEAAA